MFVAKSKSGEIINLLYAKGDVLKEVKAKAPFYCLSCGMEVVLRNRKERCYFAHKRSCLMKPKGESDVHRKGKVLLYQWLKNQGFHPQMEVYFPEIGQRADVLFDWDGKRVAMEFQCSYIPPGEIWVRTNHYRQGNIEPLWIIHDDILKSPHPYEIEYGDFLSGFIRNGFSKQAQILSLNVEKEQFIRYINLLPVSQRKIVGEKEFISLETPISDVFTSQPLSKALYDHWFLSVERWLAFFSLGKAAGKERFLRHLHTYGLHPLNLPVEVGVMVPDMDIIETPPIIWQALLWLHLLYRKRKGDHFSENEVGRLIFDHLKSFIHYRSNDLISISRMKPIHAYFRLLEELSIVTKRKNTFIVEKPLKPISNPNRNRWKCRKEFFYQNKRVILNNFG
mgnify:CR=1 FL=1